jgi:pimeloyl-ACP methyl ester carboxylesterase
MVVDCFSRLAKTVVKGISLTFKNRSRMNLRHKVKETSSVRVTVAVIAFLLISAAGYAIFQHSIYWRIKPLIEFIAQVPVSNIRVCICAPQREVEFRRDDDLRIRGSLYGHISARGQPTLLIIHGNTPLGRKLALYEVLAEKLAERGYLTLTIDRAGSGESDDPFKLGRAVVLDMNKDVYAAIDYLRSLQHAEALQAFGVHVIGHSGGAAPALSAGIKHPDIRTITAIGPPRRIRELFSEPRWRDYYWQRMQKSWKKVYGYSLPAWFTKAMWLERILDNDMVEHIQYFSSTNHKPLLLIDGGLESEDDRIFLQDYYAKITDPKSYVTIPKSDHYANTTAFLQFNLYDHTVVNETVVEINQWITAYEKQRNTTDRTELIEKVVIEGR